MSSHERRGPKQPRFRALLANLAKSVGEVVDARQQAKVTHTLPGVISPTRQMEAPPDDRWNPPDNVWKRKGWHHAGSGGRSRVSMTCFLSIAARRIAWSQMVFTLRAIPAERLNSSIFALSENSFSLQ